MGRVIVNDEQAYRAYQAQWDIDYRSGNRSELWALQRNFMAGVKHVRGDDVITACDQAAYEAHANTPIGDMDDVLHEAFTAGVTYACYCRKCLDGKVNESGIPVASTMFIVCKTCGNKRCPRANDHENPCSGSNDPGQPGSAYPSIP